jgi:minichromosome maintenance protein 10
MLNSNDDTVLEIGAARDLNWCKAMQRDGKQCFRWVDRRHTEFCTFHIDAKLKKVKASRMEVNTITAPFAPGGSTKPRFFGGAAGRGRGAAAAGSNSKETGLRSEGAMHSRVTGTYYITPSIANRSAAALMDDDDVDPDDFHRGTSRQERLRRRIVEREREREIARKLGEKGGGLGSEYLRAHATDGKTAGDSINGEPQPVIERDVQALTGGRAEEIRLSPIKRKRGASQASGSAPAVSSGIGWSFKNVRSMLKEAPPSGAMHETVREPMRKKTRFVTPKGIREAGRESFGGAAVVAEDEVVEGAAEGEVGDGDDDLDIV